MYNIFKFVKKALSLAVVFVKKLVSVHKIVNKEVK